MPTAFSRSHQRKEGLSPMVPEGSASMTPRCCYFQNGEPVTQFVALRTVVLGHKHMVPRHPLVGAIWLHHQAKAAHAPGHFWSRNVGFWRPYLLCAPSSADPVSRHF